MQHHQVAVDEAIEHLSSKVTHPLTGQTFDPQESLQSSIRSSDSKAEEPVVFGCVEFCADL